MLGESSGYASLVATTTSAKHVLGVELGIDVYSSSVPSFSTPILSCLNDLTLAIFISNTYTSGFNIFESSVFTITYNFMRNFRNNKVIHGCAKLHSVHCA